MNKQTKLSYAILGLLQQPMTGYRLRKIFETTPMGNHSSGPGTIYPALKRLQKNGLIEQVDDPAMPDRPKKVFQLTGEGRRVLIDWLHKPIEQEDIPHNLADLLLRFSFMEPHVDGDTVTAFLTSLKTALEAYTASMAAFLETSADGIPLHGRLSIENGIEAYRAQSRWAEYALEKINASNSKNR